MTTITRTRISVTRDDLTSQGLWSFYDDLERLGHNVGIVTGDAMDRHLLVTCKDGSAFKIAGHGKDNLTVRRFEDHSAYEYDEATHAEAGLTELAVLDVLDERRELARA